LSLQNQSGREAMPGEIEMSEKCNEEAGPPLIAEILSKCDAPASGVLTVAEETAVLQDLVLAQKMKIATGEADNQRMREVVSAGILELRDAGKHGVAEYMKTSLFPDPSWLERHDAETRRKVFEEAYDRWMRSSHEDILTFGNYLHTEILEHCDAKERL